jgi:hypothetical protein
MDIFFTDQAPFTLTKNMSLEQEDGNTLRSNMSVLSQKRTFAVQNVMSALPSKADMCGATRDVR